MIATSDLAPSYARGAFARRACSTLPPPLWMTAFSESAIDHEIRVWIKDPEAGLGSVRSEILHRVLELFRANDIAIPYPQRDVRVKEWPSEAAPPSR